MQSLFFLRKIHPFTMGKRRRKWDYLVYLEGIHKALCLIVKKSDENEKTHARNF